MKIETNFTHYVEYSEFEKTVATHYNVTHYNLAASEECGNDTAITSRNVFKRQLSDHEVIEIDKFVRSNGNEMWITHVLLQDMVNNDVIPEGSYVINVSW